MPPSRDPLSWLPCLTRGERCQPFLSLGLQLQPWPRLGVGDKEKIRTPNLDGGGRRWQTAQTPPCYWSAWVGDHHRYGACLVSIQPIVHDVLCHLALSGFRSLLPKRLDEGFLALRRGLSTCHFGRLASRHSSLRLCCTSQSPSLHSVTNYSSEGSCDLMVNPVLIHVEPLPRRQWWIVGNWLMN